MAESPLIPGILKPAAPSNRHPREARRRASVLIWVAGLLSLWCVFARDPPLPVLIATAAMPWLSMLMRRD